MINYVVKYSEVLLLFVSRFMWIETATKAVVFVTHKSSIRFLCLCMCVCEPRRDALIGWHYRVGDYCFKIPKSVPLNFPNEIDKFFNLLTLLTLTFTLLNLLLIVCCLGRYIGMCMNNVSMKMTAHNLKHLSNLQTFKNENVRTM